MADDAAIQSFLGQSDTPDSHIPVPRLHKCCCGNDSCAYLRYNQSALDGLERDVRTAAKLGQALLMRHEAYIADSERERKTMAAQLETLEVEKHALERRNVTVIDENRYLLDQLEAVNSAVADSDSHVTSLQATLQSTQQELHKLSQLAARTERLEQQLADFEREQATWQTSLDDKEEAEKSAVRRWQQAERTLANLQEQIERIEREAREERERHVEVVGRMERRQAVERELTSAAGRLKGAAAAKTAGRESSGTNVVSHFVKDILQDNANLQMGIVELREMLQNSNDEVEVLRKKWEDHQPSGIDGGDEVDQNAMPRKDLREELQRTASQELHVHHHYHAPASASGSKVSTIRRPKKKRYGALTPGHFTPPSGYSTPRSSISYGTPSSAATILQQTAVSIPQQIPAASKRFSTQTSHTQLSMPSSSGPSSPQSTTNRTSSLFDHVFSDAGHDSSRPTTPDTEDPGSPPFMPVNSKRGSFRTHSAPIMHHRGVSSSSGKLSLDSMLSTSADNAPMTPLQLADHDAIPEENENEWENESAPTLEEDSSLASPYSEDAVDPMSGPAMFYKQPMRRATSHESLLSISGMDIHTMQSRPAQLSNPYSARSFTTQAVLSDAQAHAAKPATMSRPSDTSRGLLSGMAADQRQSGRPSLGQKVGGWVFGRWGNTPAPSSVENTKTSVASSSKPPSRSSANDVPAFDPETTPKKAKYRPPGINQAGPIIGFPPEVRQQHLPIVKSLDAEALKKALEH